MPETDAERRDRKRMGIRLPIALEWRGGQSIIRRTRGLTRDISRQGVSCYVDEPIPEGQEISFEVVFPGELTAANPLALRCRGTSVRTSVEDRRFSLAATIQSREPIEIEHNGTDAGRRVRRRVKPEVTIGVEYPGLRALVRDLSANGAFIEDERPLPVGRVVELSLAVNHDQAPIQVRAIVRRVEPQVGMAVEFTALSEDAAHKLRQLVREKDLCLS